MDEIAGFRARSEFASVAPADFADAGENVGDRLLLAVMMNACPRSRRHLEQAAPDRRRNAERRRDGGSALGARRLRRSRIEFGRADDVDCSGGAHDVQISFEIGSHENKGTQFRGRLNCDLERSLGIEPDAVRIFDPRSFGRRRVCVAGGWRRSDPTPVTSIIATRRRRFQWKVSSIGLSRFFALWARTPLTIIAHGLPGRRVVIRPTLGAIGSISAARYH